MAKTATMKVWDVELGLAIHIEAPNGKYIVIDLGSKDGVSPLHSLLFKTVGYMVPSPPSRRSCFGNICFPFDSKKQPEGCFFAS